MLTPISTKIEEFKEKFPSYGTNVVECGEVEIETFLRTALEQRDKEWVSELKKLNTYGGAYCHYDGHVDPEDIEEIITKSKENN